LAPATLIVRRIITKLALRFHRAEGQSQPMDWPHVATFPTERPSAHPEPRTGHAPDGWRGRDRVPQGPLARD